MARRTAEVLKLLSAGQSRVHILQHTSKKWKITGRQADELIARARAQLQTLIERDNEATRDELILRLDDLYDKSLKAKKYKTCLAIAREKGDRLLGRPQQQVALSGSVDVTVLPAEDDPEDAATEAIGFSVDAVDEADDAQPEVDA
jgi:hypothetical protein